MSGAHALHARFSARLLCGWLVAVACVVSCGDAEQQIALGPMPPRPRPSAAEDAGVDIPEGAVRCSGSADCDDGVDCTDDVCLQEGYCQSIGSAARCSDGKFCNGVEVCNPELGCVPVNPPGCDDQDACTVDSCDEAQKGCAHAPRDFDGDGEIDVHCPGGTDCDDFDDSRSKRAIEVCGNQVDDNCDGTIDEEPCGRGEHDACDDALDVSSGGTFSVELAGTASDYALSCASGAARDVVFTFALETPEDVQLIARGILPGGDEETATLALQTACGEPQGEMSCRRGFPADLRARSLPKGRYYVVASSFGSTSLTLSVAFGAPTKAPRNVSCDTAIDASQGGRFVGSFVGVGDVRRASCGIEGQPDLFYEVTLTELSDLELSAIGDEVEPLTFSVQRGCSDSAQELRCESSAPVQGRFHELPAGRYVIRLEGPSSHEIGFALDVAVLPPTPPPPGDTCEHPLPMQLDTKQRVGLVDRPDAVTTSCQPSGADAVLALHVSRPMDLSVALDAGEAFAVLALQAHCGEARSDLFCRGGAPAQARIRDVAAGDYSVVVSAPAARAATLEIKSLPRSRPQLAGDNGTCRTAFDIPGTGGLFAGDTRSLGDDYHAPCGGGALSNDAVFKLVLGRASHVAADIDASFDSVLYRYEDDRAAKTACMDLGPSACDDDSGTGAQGGLDEDLDPGTYYYVVDGFKTGNDGPFLLDVTIKPL